jgi:phosphatidylglycerophosphatase A
MPAPGTWGSLAGLLYFALFFQQASVGLTFLVSAVGAYLAVGLCGEAEVRLGEKDPGKVILDEFVVMPLCFLGWRSLTGALPTWAVLVAGFALFRLFDIWKPAGIGSLQRLPGGWGVVADDVAAALAACATLHVAVWAWTA